MIREAYNIGTLCIELPLRATAMTAGVVERAAKTGSDWCKMLDDWELGVTDLSLRATHIAAYAIRNLSLAGADYFRPDLQQDQSTQKGYVRVGNGVMRVD